MVAELSFLGNFSALEDLISVVLQSLKSKANGKEILIYS